jgi:hypothetical protein
MEQPGLGRTPGFAEVETDPGGAPAGTFATVRVTASDGLRLRSGPLVTKCAP